MIVPNGSGFLVRAARGRVIKVTPSDGNRHTRDAEMLGFVDYIRKPFAMDRLREHGIDPPRHGIAATVGVLGAKLLAVFVLTTCK